MTARTAEPVVQIKVPKRGIDVVQPHQAHHTPSEPHTFRVSGRTVDGLGCFSELVGLALVVLGRFRRLGRTSRSRFAGLVLGPAIATLG